MRWHGNHLNSIFYKRGDRLEFIKTGSHFRHVRADKTVETAEVLAVYTDSYGIPHIRFSVSFERPHRLRFNDGPRNLALRSFCEHYVERVFA